MKKIGVFIMWVGWFSLLVGVNSCHLGSKNNINGGQDTLQVLDTADTTPNNKIEEVAFGTFQLLLRQDSVTSFLGRMYNGPLPSTIIWQAVDSSGPCKLLKPRTPLCQEPCGSSAACVEDDSCQPYPKVVNVGTLTLSGVETDKGTKDFTMDPIGGYYQPMGISLKFPPFKEGDVVTLSATGSQEIPPFTLKLKGFKPLAVLNDSFPCGEGQAIELKWEPPSINLHTIILVMVDISYHGGTKAKIECECEDNGKLTIPAFLLDKLKGFGISGYPKIEVSRRAVAYDPTSKARFIIESRITKFLSIPGIISCSEDTQCPEGEYCANDQRCRKIEE